MTDVETRVDKLEEQQKEMQALLNAIIGFVREHRHAEEGQSYVRTPL
jgi:hypothetical protein